MQEKPAAYKLVESPCYLKLLSIKAFFTKNCPVVTLPSTMGADDGEGLNLPEP